VSLAPFSSTATRCTAISRGPFFNSNVTLIPRNESNAHRFDFYCYTQLNATLEKVFFPTQNATIQALAFWGVYAAAFVVR